MQNWDLVRPVVKQVLREQRYPKSGAYCGEACFLTAYQIAVLVNNRNDQLKGNLPVGGKGVGPDSFAKQIARRLSEDVKENFFDEKLEIRFLSLKAIESLVFNGDNEPSVPEVSMFRLRD